MSGEVRCFVAVDVPAEVRDAVAGFLACEGAGVRGIRWVAPELLHLTLAFLGGVPQERIGAIAAALQVALGGCPPFRAEARGAGAFPTPARPRVVWVGIGEGAARMAGLASLAGAALEPLGFPRDERPFAAHLTVGRAKAPPRDPAPLRRLLDAARDRPFGAFVVPAVLLMRSDLFPSGPRYTILHETRLAGAPGEAACQGSER